MLKIALLIDSDIQKEIEETWAGIVSENIKCAASPWLPMEQAPRDGTLIFAKYERPVIFYDVICWKGDWWKDQQGQGRPWIPCAFAHIYPPETNDKTGGERCSK